jgi:hypothetical protein
VRSVQVFSVSEENEGREQKVVFMREVLLKKTNTFTIFKKKRKKRERRFSP